MHTTIRRTTNHPTSLAKAMKAEAKRLGITVTALANELIREGLRKRGQVC